jgi:uncharacterized protein (TIGR02246 family)
MTRDQILAALERRRDAWASHDSAALAAMYTPDGVVISPTGGVLEGREEIERVYRLWFGAFPDISAREDELLVDGLRAALITTMSATHAGDFFGLAPTGRRFEVQMASLFTFDEAGLIREERRIYDFTGLLVKVGVLKAKPVG